jgi:cytochrome b involved in lipid metabolism
MLHRGGEEVMLDVGGQDATEAFEDVGHSDEAREILEGLLVGTLKRQVHTLPSFPTSSTAYTTLRPDSSGLGRGISHENNSLYLSIRRMVSYE